MSPTPPSGSSVVLQQRLTMAHGDGLGVHVHDAGLRVHALRDLVNVARRRNAGAYVQKLLYAGIRHETGHPPKKSAIRPHNARGFGIDLHKPPRRPTVGLEAL